MDKFIFSLIFVLTFAFQSSAQSLLKDGKIPDDLVITVKKQEGWGGSYSEMMINAKGEFSHHSSGGMPAFPQTDLILVGVKIKPIKYLKPHLSLEKLNLLITEFEKIQFLKFGKDFPIEDEKEIWYISDKGGEAISIRINGQIKEVSYDLGEFSKRTRILKNLAERIRGARIWNYENDEIPENFRVNYQITDGDKIKKDLKINAKGKITETIYTSRLYENIGKELPVLVKTKKVGKLSQKQVKKLINEFENIVFSGFRYSKLDKFSGCSNEPNSNLEKRKSINVQINYVSQMYASLYENCNAKLETEAAKFEYIVSKLEEILGTKIESKNFNF
jgi:hypothetical protein